MLTDSRYKAIRNRLIELHNTLNNQTFQFWVKPSSLMTIEQLRNRETYSQEGFANDAGYYEEFQLRNFTIPQLSSYLPNFTGSNEIGFRDANKDVITIYEGLQEYISLWCELAYNDPNLNTPPLEELRALENVAYFVFPIYKSIKPYVVNKEFEELAREDAALHQRGLVGLGALLGVNLKQRIGTEQLSFESHLDAFEATVNKLDMTEPTFVNQSQNTDVLNSELKPDSIFTREEETENTWLFEG